MYAGEGRDGEGGRMRERGRAVKGRGDERGKGGKNGGEGQMRMDRWRGERPFGSSERVSKSDPFSSNNRLSISRTFPGTLPNNHTLPFPDVLAQTPKFTIIPLSGSDPLVRRTLS